MSLLRTSRWITGIPVLCALLFCALPDRAAYSKDDAKWDSKRTTPPEDLDEIKALQERVKKIVDKGTPCTVAILIGFETGSGVIVSEDGLILTTADVLTVPDRKGIDPLGFNPQLPPGQLLKEKTPFLNQKPAAYESGRVCAIVLSDGKRVKAKSLGVNTVTNCGMVKITDNGPNDGKWPFLSVAKSGDLQKGQWVVSLGHPGGPKPSRQPVARLGRIERNSKENVASNCTLIAGDFGGPLLNLDGNVVGVHSRIFTTLSMNYHIPTEHFIKQWDNLAAGEVFGEVAKKPAGPPPRLGVVFPEDDNDDAWVTDLEETGPAAKAGIKPGDTITKINGVTIKSVKQFREVMKDKKPGDVVKIMVRRAEKSLTLSVTLDQPQP